MPRASFPPAVVDPARAVIRWLTVLFLALALHREAKADAPLHEQIDALLEANAAGSIPPPAADAEFLRRIYLDLKGTIPTPAEARAFFADTVPDKRAKLVDSLLVGPDYPRRMRELFHVMLMERRGSDEKWDAYLEKSFADNKSWDVLVREVLRGEPGDDNALEGVQFFLTKRLENYGQNPVDYPALTRDIGRLFLGVDLQCAACHDHLFIDDYKQADFQGLFAFTANSVLKQEGGRAVAGENALAKKLDFVSVFEKVPRQTGPRLPGGKEFDVPEFKQGEEFAVPPDPSKQQPGKLKFSPRAILAEELPKAENQAFCRNIANRLWWLTMGRGLVEPLDLHHNDNPPSQPEVLDLLTREIAARGFDIKSLLRELYLTRAYGRTSAMAEGEQPPQSFLLFLHKGLSAEQLCWSLLQATGELDRLRQSASHPAGADAKIAEAKKAALPLFLAAFASPPLEPETEFRTSVKAALFLRNDGLVQRWLEPQPGNLTDRLNKLTDANQLADELYLSILTRLPSEEERSAIAAYLAKRADNRPQAVKNLAWSLLASSEFCVNH